MSPEPDPRCEPEISVVTIFWNEERHLAEAVESVLAQTGCHWELVLVDDGSTDASPNIALGYAQAHPDRIRYLAHADGRNRGMSAARNLGIASARGRWLTFLDADDVWTSGKLEAQLGALARHPEIRVLASPAQWWYGHSAEGPGGEDWVQDLGPVPARGQPADGEADEIVVRPPALLTAFLDDEWRSICDLVIDRAVVDAVGGYEPLFQGMYEDQVFHAKVLARWPALVTSQWWYRYRQHPDACTATSHRAGAHLAARQRFLDWLARYLDGADLDTALDQAGLRRAVRVHRRRVRHPRAARVAARVRRAIAWP